VEKIYEFCQKIFGSDNLKDTKRDLKVFGIFSLILWFFAILSRKDISKILLLIVIVAPFAIALIFYFAYLTKQFFILIYNKLGVRKFVLFCVGFGIVFNCIYAFVYTQTNSLTANIKIAVRVGFMAIIGFFVVNICIYFFRKIFFPKKINKKSPKFNKKLALKYLTIHIFPITALFLILRFGNELWFSKFQNQFLTEFILITKFEIVFYLTLSFIIALKIINDIFWNLLIKKKTKI
jgi:hypothetical protein